MEASQAWQTAQAQLQTEMSKASYETWVRNAELVKFDQNCFTIGVQNAYARDWLENRLSSTVSRLLTGLMNLPQAVQFTRILIPIGSRTAGCLAPATLNRCRYLITHAIFPHYVRP